MLQRNRLLKLSMVSVSRTPMAETIKLSHRRRLLHACELAATMDTLRPTHVSGASLRDVATYIIITKRSVPTSVSFVG